MSDLAVRLLTVDHHDSAAAQLDKRSVIGGIAPACMRRTKHRGAKRLRGLHRNQGGPRGRVDDNVVGIDSLDRVGHRYTRHCCIGAFGHRCDNCREELRRGERASRIVDADDGGRCWNLDKTGADRLAARRPTGDATFRRRIGWRDHENDTIADRSSDIESVINDALRAKLFVLLGTTDPRPGAPGDHDGPHILSCGERHDRRG